MAKRPQQGEFEAELGPYGVKYSKTQASLDAALSFAEAIRELAVTDLPLSSAQPAWHLVLMAPQPREDRRLGVGHLGVGGGVKIEDREQRVQLARGGERLRGRDGGDGSRRRRRWRRGWRLGRRKRVVDLILLALPGERASVKVPGRLKVEAVRELRRGGGAARAAGARRRELDATTRGLPRAGHHAESEKCDGLQRHGNHVDGQRSRRRVSG